MRLRFSHPFTRSMLQAAALAFLIVILTVYTRARAQELVHSHDNMESAGSLMGNRLTLELAAEQGTWYPGGEDGFGLPMYAFRELDGPLLIPGPLLRVP
ncbi:MAG: hypothetical protein RL120_02120, partial [Gammaproteobacteria bacterium]